MKQSRNEVINKSRNSSITKLFSVSLLACICLFFISNCTKVIAYGATNETPKLTHSYSSNIQTAFYKTQEALKSLGYDVSRIDESRNRITTAWTQTTSDSHYLYYFKRRDYGAGAGSYYQLVADVYYDAGKINVSVHTVVKSISGKLKSSFVVEKQALKQIDDFMRKAHITITNVGMQEN